jgi:hypothetical protein
MSKSDIHLSHQPSAPLTGLHQRTNETMSMAQEAMLQACIHRNLRSSRFIIQPAAKSTLLFQTK